MMLGQSLPTTAPLGTQVTPPSLTTNPRRRSSSASSPTRAPGRTSTALSRIARRTSAPPGNVPSADDQPLLAFVDEDVGDDGGALRPGPAAVGLVAAGEVIE